MIHDKSNVILLEMLSIDSQVPSLRHGSKSGSFSLARTWYLICEIHIKHALLAVLSKPEMNTCQSIHVYSLSTYLSYNRYGLEYMNPYILSLVVDIRISLHLVRTILVALLMSKHPPSPSTRYTCTKVSTTS